MNLASKNLFWSLINLVLIVVLIFGLKGLVFREYTRIERTIVVSGEGKITATPDIARISFSMTTEGKNPETIQAENTRKMNAAIAFLKEQGIAEKDIKTSNYSLYPKYDYTRPPVIFYPDGNRQEIIGYTLTQSVMVKVRDLEKVGKIFSGITAQGINQIDSLSFDIDDPESVMNEARDEAFKKARDKAKAMARSNGVRLGRVVTFSESQSGWPIPYYRLEAAALPKDAGGGAPPEIEPGSQEVTVSVSVTYEIR